MTSLVSRTHEHGISIKQNVHPSSMLLLLLGHSSISFGILYTIILLSLTCKRCGLIS